MNAFALLQGKVEREGFLKKTASAKGEDKVRGNWQERWFVLKGHTLNYYKKKGDSNPKGNIDLRASRVDDADAITNKPFTVRVAQSKQIFNYLQCANQEDKDAWLLSLRKCAGYKQEKEDSVIQSQAEGYCAFEVYYQANVNTKTPQHAVLLFNPADRGALQIYQRDKLIKAHPTNTIIGVELSRKPDAVSPVDGQISLYSITVDFKSENYLTRKIFLASSFKEGEVILHLLAQVRQNIWTQVKAVLGRAPLHSGTLSVHEGEGWSDRWVLLVETRCLIYEERHSIFPLRVIYIDGCVLKPDGKTGINVAVASGEKITFRIKDSDPPEQRDVWVNAFRGASISLKDQIEHDMKVGESVTNPLITPAQAKVSPAASPVVSPRGGLDVGGGNSGVAVDLSAAFRGVGAAEMKEKTETFVVTWGLGEDGQLGHRAKDSLALPKLVEALRGKRVRCAASGRAHTACVTDQGHVYTWGMGEEMQLGLGGARLQSSSPYLVTSLRSAGPIVRVACGRAHCIVLSSTGEVYAWGANNHGQLGTGNTTNAQYPVKQEDISTKGVRQICAGGDRSAAIVDKGLVAVWGSNEHGALGLATEQDTLTPAALLGLSKHGSCTSIAFGPSSSAAILDTGALLVWGSTADGRLGLPGDAVQGKKSINEPTEVTYFRAHKLKLQQVALGEKHGLVIAVNENKENALYTWGSAKSNGHGADVPTPTPLALPKPPVYAACGDSHSVVIVEGLGVYAFGTAGSGELGNGQLVGRGVVTPSLNAAMEAVLVTCGNRFATVLFRGDPPQDVSVARAAPALPHPAVAPTEVKREEFDINPADLRANPSITESQANAKISNLLQIAHVKGVAVHDDPPPASPLSPVTSPLNSPVAKPTEAPTDGAPADAALSPTSGEAKKKRKTASGEIKKEKKKKPLWKEAVDPKSGRTYYYNTKTRETKWHKPEDADATVDA